MSTFATIDRAETVKNDPAAGFSLLEVMIAMAIISIALISLQALNNRTIATHSYLQKMTQATMLAQYKMTEIEVQAEAALMDDETQGFFDTPHDQYEWQVSFRETPLASVRMVTVEVAWGDKDRNEFVSIDSFIF